MYFGLEVFIRYQGRHKENFKTKFVHLILHTKNKYNYAKLYLEIVLWINHLVGYMKYFYGSMIKSCRE